MSRGPYPILLVLAMSLPGAARALGLGDIRVDSALNEPLSAQIDIVGATRDELIDLTARVANRDVFQHYDADRPAFLSSATFTVGLDARGRPVLNVRSAEPFTDPVVDFLVELHWDHGELIREYSLLLDPAGFGPSSRLAAAPDGPGNRLVAPPDGSRSFATRAPDAARSPAVVGVARASTAAARAASAKPPGGASNGARAGQDRGAPPGGASNRTLAASAQAAQQVGGSNGSLAESDPAARYRVAPHDTLRGIVRHAGASSESQAQRMMIAIFRANPHAFDGNINRLHLGAELTMPSAIELAAVDGVDAEREVRTQSTAWSQEGRQAAPRRVAAAMAPANAGTSLNTRARVNAAAPAAAAASGAAVTTASGPGSGAVVPSSTAASSVADLTGQVQSLERALNDAHQQLERQRAAQSSLDVVQSPVPAPPSSTVESVPAHPPVAVESVPAHPPVAAESVPAHPPVAVESVPAHPAINVEVLHTGKHPSPILAAVAPPTSAWLYGKAFIGTVAALIALLLAGFAYRRRQVFNMLPSSGYADQTLLTDASPAARRAGAASQTLGAADMHAVPASLPAHEPQRLTAAPPASRPVEQPRPVTLAAPIAIAAATVAPPAVIPPAVIPPAVAPHAPHATHDAAARATSDDTTQDLAIDTEALERSYLDTLAIDDLGIDTLTNHPALPAALTSDTAAHETAGLDTVVLETPHLARPLYRTSAEGAGVDDAPAAGTGGVGGKDGLHHALFEGSHAAPDAVNSVHSDFTLVDLDATAQHIQAHHVQMPSQLNDHIEVSERRMNIVDVLKRAIDRDPNRRDLRMKLLETYYGTASINRRAFLEVVKKLPREALTAEEWKKIVVMGREIAADDSLFVDAA